jgi:hypothetical protein
MHCNSRDLRVYFGQVTGSIRGRDEMPAVHATEQIGFVEHRLSHNNSERLVCLPFSMVGSTGELRLRPVSSPVLLDWLRPHEA